MQGAIQVLGFTFTFTVASKKKKEKHTNKSTHNDNSIRSAS